MTLIFQSLLFLRKDDENGKGGTLSGNKLNAYVLLKIFKILFGISLSSFSLKFAIDRSLVDERSAIIYYKGKNSCRCHFSGSVGTNYSKPENRR